MAVSFFIVTNNEDQSDGLAIQYYPEKIIEAYKKRWRATTWWRVYRIGQVTEGYGWVDKIASGEGGKIMVPERNLHYRTSQVTEVKVLQEPKK